jgi:hypothetical protein
MSPINGAALPKGKKILPKLIKAKARAHALPEYRKKRK